MTDTASAQPTPHPSVQSLVTGNGVGVGHISLTERRMRTFFPHAYRQYDEGAPLVSNWLYDAYFGVRRGAAVWLPEVELAEVGYLPGTGIVEVAQDLALGDTGQESLRATQYLFFPFELDQPVAILLLRLSNEGDAAVGGFAAFSLQNFHIGGGEGGVELEAFERFEAKGYLERGRDGIRVYHRSLVVPDGYHVGTGADSPYQRMKDGGDFADTSTGPGSPGSDLAAGFQFNRPEGLQPGEEMWIGLALAGREDGADATLREKLDAWIGERGPAQLLEAERAGWASWMARAEAHVPAGLSAEERRVWEQSLAMLRMGQVREPNGPEGSGHKPFGQLLAALPKAHPREGEGIWNASWPRDASYAIAGLARAGFAEEARAGLEFMLRADAGEYAEEVGYDYRISVCRYYGRGREESDWNDDGPNIEFDDFGLFLMALGEQVDAAPEAGRDWWKGYWPEIRDGVADVLVALHEEETGLIAPDSSIWERHWNGKQKHFTYTSAMAAQGLCVAAGLAEEMGDEARAEAYRETVSKLRRGIYDRLLTDDGVLAGNLEELQRGGGFMDAAAVEVFNFGAIEADDPSLLATLDAWDRHLYDGDLAGYGGYKRNDDGDWYDEQEWVVVDLRLAIAHAYAGQTARRDQLLEWITAQTLANHGIMGELYCRGEEDCPQRGTYRGSVPMIGFGPGAYILALTERERGDVQPTMCAPMARAGTGGGGEPDAGGGGGGSVGDGGEYDGPLGGRNSSDAMCQCSAIATPPSGSGRGFGLGIAGAALVWWTRRRRWGTS